MEITSVIPAMIWSGAWCDICVEQTLMKAAKSEGGLSRGRMRNSNSDHKSWVLTLSHFSNVNQKEGVKKHAPSHRDLAKTQMKRDAEAVEHVLPWFEENNPSTMMETTRRLYLSLQDSQAQEITQSMLREPLR